MPYLYKLYHVIEFDIYMYIYKYIIPLPCRHLMIKGAGVDSMNIYQRICVLVVCFSTNIERLAFLFNEFKLNKLMQEKQYTLYL